MNKHKLGILYVISSSRTRKDNKATLVCRLTYLKSRKQFATGVYIVKVEANTNNASLKLVVK